MNNIDSLRERVVAAMADPAFIHHAWYDTYHMRVVEQIALEACEHYPEADREHVLALVWVHDYEKIVDVSQKDNRELAATRKLLADCQYDDRHIERVVADTNTINEKLGIAQESIEIQIVSSADGASHVVGPFMDLYWHENPQKPMSEIMASNAAKIEKDWAKKITVPEIRAAFEDRRRHELEAAGQLPERYL